MDTDNKKEEGKIETFSDQLRTRIKNGEFGTRGRIPGITELAKEWKTTRTTVYSVVQLLQSEGLLLAKGNSLYVCYPSLQLEGLTENFERFLRAQGYEVTMENVIVPSIEPMPPEAAAMFHQPEGVRVVHRVRKQGVTGLALRIAENWYPVSLAGEFVDQMRADEHMDVLGAIKQAHGLYIEDVQDVIYARIPTTQEVQVLGIGRTEPIVEIRRSNFASNGTPIMWNKVIHVAPHFKFTYRYKKDYWK